MCKIMHGTILIVNLSLLIMSASYAAGNPEQGKLKAGTCLGCYGIPSYTNAYPTFHAPRLGGQYGDYIAAALKAYRAGERNDHTMQAQAAKSSLEEMADIGAYFESLQ